jgi:chromosome segregation ATPase
MGARPDDDGDDGAVVTHRLEALESSMTTVVTFDARLTAVEQALANVGQALEGVVAEVHALLSEHETQARTIHDHYGTLQHHHEALVRHDLVLEDHEGKHAAAMEHARLLLERIELTAVQAFARHHDGLESIRTQYAELVAYVDEELNGLRHASASQIDALRASFARKHDEREGVIVDLGRRVTELEQAANSSSEL